MVVKLKKTLSIFAVGLLIFWSSMVPQIAGANIAVAQETPSQPSQPSQPHSPSQPSNPDQPDQPENPDQPTNPDQPGSAEDPDPNPTLDVAGSTSNDTDTSGQTSSDTTLVTPATNTSSGSQESEGNMGETTLISGDADAIGTLYNSLNTNVAGATTIPSSGASIVNEGNNSGSQNASSLNSSAVSDTNQTNAATIVNTVNGGAYSGDNEVRDNMNGDILISTGDANTAVTLVNQANTNIAGVGVVEFNVVDDHVGDLVLDFSNPCATGGCVAGTPVYAANIGNNTDTQNTIETTSNVENTTFQGNDATVENNLILTSDSGYNLASDNMNGDVTVETGEANVSANVVNFVNNNLAGNVLFGVVNIFGDLIGDIIVPAMVGTQSAGTNIANSDNNSGSQNFTGIDQSVMDQVYQDNDLTLDNNIIADANTGDNTLKDNINGSNSIETGNTNVVAQIFNIANTNVLGGDWWIVLVNDAGNWIGRIVGGQEGMNYGGSAGTEFAVNPDGSITATNSGNNSDSQNSQTVNQTVDNTYNQQNTANIVNNLDLTANTGKNTVKDNANGDTSITTGDANIVASIVNFVNNNFVGGRVYVTVVNILGGSWLGDFVGPGQEKQEDALADNLGDNNDNRPIGGTGDQPDNTDDPDTRVNTTTSNTKKAVIQVNTTLPTPTFSSGSIALLNDGLILGDSDNANDLQNSNVSTQGKKKVRINLAWLFVFLPAVVLPKFRKKYLASTLPDKGND